MRGSTGPCLCGDPECPRCFVQPSVNDDYDYNAWENEQCDICGEHGLCECSPKDEGEE